MTVEISSIYSASAGEEIHVAFTLTEDGERHTEKRTMVISAKQYLELGLTKGECTTEVFDSVAYASSVWNATRKGIFLLGYGACSERALRSKLVAKGFSKEIAELATQEIVSMGLIDPMGDALREAQKQAKKLLGKKRIISALYEKGYSAQSVAYAMQTLEDEGINYVLSCERLIRKKHAELPEDPNEIRKLTASLQRYGYSISEIKSAYRSF